MIWKFDDLRKDLIISNVIRTMDAILKKNLDGISVPLWTYRVVPTSCHSGFLERIQHAETLETIRASDYPTPMNYLADFNEGSGEGLEKALQRFHYSTAAWAVVAYLLGLGDRHLHNLMLSHSGVLFHIDYGFILGKDPKFYAPLIRLSEVGR